MQIDPSAIDPEAIRQAFFAALTLGAVAGVQKTAKQAVKEAYAALKDFLQRREKGDGAGEATTLNNMGLVYNATRRSGEALALYEQALPIMSEVGNRTEQGRRE